jgi:hypothetical protein
MGFSLESMIRDLEGIIAKEQKPAKTKKELAERLAWWKKYAEQCGQLK